MFEADAWRIWWWGRVVILANCCLHVFCLHLKYRIHRCIYEVFHEVYPSQQGAQQFSVCLFSLLFCLLGHHSFYIFFSGSHSCVSPSGGASSLPQALVSSSMLRHDHTATEAWGGYWTKALELLALDFLVRSWTASNTCYFGPTI